MKTYSLKSNGFTLVELVTVIMLLGIVAAGVGSIIKFSSQIYVDVTSRDELIASARFSVERLNREIRSALPNSVQTLTVGSATCLEYMPIAVSTVYTDIPVSPEPDANTVTVVKFDDSLFNASQHIVVYPLNSSEIYGNASSKRYALASPQTLNTAGNEWTLNLASANTFADDSPTQRLFLVNQPVAYCVEGSELYRYSNYGYQSNILTGSQSLMAQGIDPTGTSFIVNPATLVRNALITIELQFFQNEETVHFFNEVQVQNVP